MIAFRPQLFMGHVHELPAKALAPVVRVGGHGVDIGLLLPGIFAVQPVQGGGDLSFFRQIQAPLRGVGGPEKQVDKFDFSQDSESFIRPLSWVLRQEITRYIAGV